MFIKGNTGAKFVNFIRILGIISSACLANEGRTFLVSHSYIWWMSHANLKVARKIMIKHGALKSRMYSSICALTFFLSLRWSPPLFRCNFWSGWWDNTSNSQRLECNIGWSLMIPDRLFSCKWRRVWRKIKAIITWEVWGKRATTGEHCVGVVIRAFFRVLILQLWLNSIISSFWYTRLSAAWAVF